MKGGVAAPANRASDDLCQDCLLPEDIARGDSAVADPVPCDVTGTFEPVVSGAPKHADGKTVSTERCKTTESLTLLAEPDSLREQEGLKLAARGR